MLESCCDHLPATTFEVPVVASLALEPNGTISEDELSECSGIVAARKWPGRYLVHNDSGDEPRIFLKDSAGSGVSDDSIKSLAGIHLSSSEHVDWEEITYFKRDLLIADIGNNANQRRDLTLYQFSEPHNLSSQTVPLRAKYEMTYPDQKWGWFAKKNFDCEAAFSCPGKLYLVSKHRSDRKCTLYRFDTLKVNQVNIPSIVGRADFGQKVTAQNTAGYHTINYQTLP